MLKADHTVAIIGAGVAGLAAGSHLARHGYAVKVFEATSRLGGACADTQVDGYVFNQGAQYLMLSSMLDHVFGRLGVDREQVLPLRRVTTPQTIVLPDGATVTLEENLGVSTSSRAIDAAQAQQELRRLAARWQPLLQAFLDEEVLRGPFSYRRLLARVWRHLPRFGHTLQAELRASFRNPSFRNALGGLMLYAGAHPRVLPAPAIIALVSELTDGMALPEGGMGRIPEALARTLSQNGGELILNAPVRRILVREGRVCAVEVEGFGQVEAQSVLSTVSALTTYASLLPVDVQPGWLQRKVRRTPLSMKAFTIQLGLSNVIDTPGHLTYVLLSDGQWGRHFPQPRPDFPWVYYSVPTVVIPELAPAGGSIVELAPAIRDDEPASAWDEDRSRRLADAAIGWLAERHALKVAVSRIRNPRDFEAQLRLYEGAIYGVSPAAGVLGLFPHRGPVPGLYLAGQTTFPGFGIPTAALSGIYSAEALRSARRGATSAGESRRP